MAYPGAIKGLCSLMEKHGVNHKILDIESDYDAQKICAVLYNNFGVLNYHLAILCGISSGEMNRWRRVEKSELGSEINCKLSDKIIPKILMIIKLAKELFQDQKKKSDKKK